MTDTPVKSAATTTIVITPEQLLEHWQGHRRLTRKVIEAFPEEKLFTFSIGGMRPFAELVLEFIGMAEPGMKGLVSGDWSRPETFLHRTKAVAPATKKGLLERWDQVTEHINEYFPQIAPQRFQEMDKAFGEWDGPIYFFINYWIDNEVHHRGQGTVYLRALGIEPPAFWDRY